jgi:hypothetical protein
VSSHLLFVPLQAITIFLQKCNEIVYTVDMSTDGNLISSRSQKSFFNALNIMRLGNEFDYEVECIDISSLTVQAYNKRLSLITRLQIVCLCPLARGVEVPTQMVLKP